MIFLELPLQVFWQVGRKRGAAGARKRLPTGVVL